MSFSFRRFLGIGIDRNKKVEVRKPVLLEDVKAGDPPDAGLEREASALSRQLAHGYMVMNKTAAQVRAEMSAAALSKLDRRPN